jgi:hypothetical protein
MTGSRVRERRARSLRSVDQCLGRVIALDLFRSLAPQLTRQCEHNRADEDPDEAQELEPTDRPHKHPHKTELS